MDRSATESIRSLSDPLEGRETGPTPAPIGITLGVDHAPATFYQEFMGFLGALPAGAAGGRA